MLTPQAFAEKWAGAALSERASHQQHFLDLCAMLEAPASAEVDPRREFYAFEKGMEKTGGGKGFADVWYENHSIGQRCASRRSRARSLTRSSGRRTPLPRNAWTSCAATG